MSLADCRHVFVVTNARSGAALLQSLLNCTDGVQIRGENQNALFHRFRCSAAVSTAADRGRAGRQAAPDKPWFAAGSIRPQRCIAGNVERFVGLVLCPDPGPRSQGSGKSATFPTP